jgi:hypothetical protein
LVRASAALPVAQHHHLVVHQKDTQARPLRLRLVAVRIPGFAIAELLVARGATPLGVTPIVTELRRPAFSSEQDEAPFDRRIGDATVRANDDRSSHADGACKLYAAKNYYNLRRCRM